MIPPDVKPDPCPMCHCNRDHVLDSKYVQELAKEHNEFRKEVDGNYVRTVGEHAESLVKERDDAIARYTGVKLRGDAALAAMNTAMATAEKMESALRLCRSRVQEVLLAIARSNSVEKYSQVVVKDDLNKIDAALDAFDKMKNPRVPR